MYLGVATQAAVASSQQRFIRLACGGSTFKTVPTSISNLQSSLLTWVFYRIRTWLSLCALDLLVCSFLGRPSATSTLQAELGNHIINAMSQTDRMDICLLESCRVTCIIGDVAKQLYGEKVVPRDAAEIVLRKLKQWSNELPNNLTTSSILASHQAQEHTLCSLNVACFYYFTVMLITRPFLISTLTARLSNHFQGLSGGSSAISIEEGSPHADLASACIDSAAYLVQICLDVHKAGLLLENMCILK
jgi:hypothetical protein